MAQLPSGAAAQEEPEVLKSIAISGFDSESPHVRAYTSPRLLRDLTSGQLLDEACSRSNTNVHELFVVSRVSCGDGTTCLSCVCANCRKHFHVTHRNPSGADWNQTHNSGMHMFLLFDRKNRNELRATQPRHAFIQNQVRLACAVDGCACSVDIVVLSPVLSNADIDSFLDAGRPRRHLANAKVQDPGRFAGTADWYGDDTIRIFLQYLKDGLTAAEEAKPKKIKKRNKKFTVCFGDDFDPLLRSLGFVESSELGDDGELETSWHIPVLEPESARTRIGTLRAKWESTEAELKILNGFGLQEPGWDYLRSLLGVSYSSPANVQIAHPANVEPFDLLGCLIDFKASVYAWAATLLAEKCPKRRAALYVAAKDIVTSRAWDSEYEDALISLTQHESSFDMVPVFQGAESGQPGGPMQPHQAAKYMGIEFDFPIDLIRDIVNNKAQEPQTDRAKAAEALDVMASWKRANVPGEEGEKMAAELDAMAEIFKTARPRSPIPDLVMDDAAVSPNIPPGLRNIGNTCYLNSLLQYFYNVKPIRELVIDHTRPRLEIDDDTLKARRTGGNGTTVDLDEAIVAKQFTESLESLFVDLQTTTHASAQPSQKLANTALKSARALLAQQPESKPPPLPARPSPAPPTVQKEGVDMVNVTVEPVNDAQEASSSISSQTLVNDGDAMLLDSYVEVAAPHPEHEAEKRGRTPAEDVVEVEHVEAAPADKPSWQDMTLDERYKEISERLEHSERKGTDQQDVGEIIENIMEHLMRSVPSDGPMAGRPDLQSDTITRTFFPMLVNYTIGLQGEGRSESKKEEVLPDRWISAFPHPKDGVKSTIYEALDRSNDLQKVDTNLMRYTAIRSLPPILHICIQRSGAVKNRNPVVVEDELFMDRYMDTAEIQQLRIRAWAWKHHLAALEEGAENETAANPKPTIMQQTKEALQAGGNVTQMAQSWDSPADGTSTTQRTDAQGAPAAEPFDGSLCDWTFLEQPKIAVDEEAASDVDQLPAAEASMNPTITETETPEFMAESTVDIGSILRDEVANAHTADDWQRQSIKTTVDSQFAGLKKERYLLHAVICHGGNVRAGHYWVWIRDFKRNVWLKYNDSTVTEESGSSQAVLDKLNEGGDPYYLAYVLEDKKDDLVEVPPRAVPEPDAPITQAHDFAEMQTIEGVDPNGDEKAPLVTTKQFEASQADAMSIDEPPPYQLL